MKNVKRKLSKKEETFLTEVWPQDDKEYKKVIKFARTKWRNGMSIMTIIDLIEDKYGWVLKYDCLRYWLSYKRNTSIKKQNKKR